MKKAQQSPIKVETDITDEEINQRLNGLLNAKNDDFIFELQAERNGLQTLVSTKVTHSELNFALLVQVATRLCSKTLQRKLELNTIGLLEVLMASDFFKHLTLHLTTKPPNDCLSLFSNTVQIFEKIFTIFPPDSTEVLRENIRKIIQAIQTVQNSSNDVKRLIGQLKRLSLKPPRRAVKTLKSPLGRGLTLEEWDNATAPQNNFRHIPVTITQADVHEQLEPIIYPNIINGPYEDVEHYLDVQYRLFREDFVGPMREAITQFIKPSANDDNNSQFDGVNVYKSVYIRDAFISETTGIIRELNFNVELSGCSDLDWISTRRLLIGSLVCLSSDNFKNVSVAVVANSCPMDLANGSVYVKFLAAHCGGFSKPFVMIESPTYYEAYAPVLRGLKQVDPVKLPFQDVLINVSTKIQPTGYARDFTWPSAEQLKMDESQYGALKAALTREIAIIQGPPATGKTYVGLKVVELLLQNTDGQILVVCYTNHALDQFLEGILKFHSKELIRVGGRSKSEKLDKYNLNSMYMPSCLYHKIAVYKKVIINKIRRANVKMASYRRFFHFDFQNRIIPEWLLVDLGVISDKHAMQLEEAMFEGDPRWNNALDIWLNAADYRVINSNGADASVRADEQTPLTTSRNRSEDTVFDVLDKVIRANQIQNDEDDQEMVSIGAEDKQDVVINCESGFSQEIEEAIQKISTTDQLKINQTIKTELRMDHHMEEKRASKVDNIWNLESEDRWSLYRLWLSRAQDKVKKTLLQLQTYSERQWEMYSEFKQECYLNKFKGARVIGMTTSGAARHRRNLQKLQPPILIVEEAAEVLEAHVISALTPMCQHLILIGDQQQLRPKPSVYELEKDYHLDVSLFERLINNGLPYERLQLQHRMRPEISNLLVPNIYPDLLDHIVVKKYKNIAGMKTNVYFLNHNFEETNVADCSSKSNSFEADLLIGLCDYLTNQGYKSSQITVLTGYSGQVALFQDKLPESVRCTSIDGYQGEENDIILLSLVRSNTKGAVGFLKVENRVCVALSRAKMGLYCVGNFDLLSSETEVWKPIVEKLSEADLIGPCFSLVCQNHPETVTEIRSIEDFSQVCYGGCSQPCPARLQCSHNCPLTCHILDRNHKNINCEATRENQLICGHSAKIPCGVNIQYFLCQQVVEHTLQCGHQAQMFCSTDKSNYECKIPVTRVLKCGHTQMAPCGQAHLSCLEKCNRTLYKCGHKCQLDCNMRCDVTQCVVEVEARSQCGHTETVPCNDGKNANRYCKYPCATELPCGHVCKGSCSSCNQGRIHIICVEKCSRILLSGETCSNLCSSICLLSHSIKVQPRCGHGVNSTKCSKLCNWQCVHKSCTKKCDEMCDRDSCDVPCPLKLKCGHSCLGYCGEPCPQFCLVCSPRRYVNKFVFGFKKNNKKLRYVLLEDCNHVIERGAMDSWMKMKQSSEGDEIISLKTCPKCKAVITSNFRYGNVIRTAQNDVDAVKREMNSFCAKIKRNNRKILNSIVDNLSQLDNFLPVFKQSLIRLAKSQDFNTFDIIFLINSNTLVQKISAIYNTTKTTLKTIKGKTNQITPENYKSERQDIRLIQKHLQDLESILVSMVSQRSLSNVLWQDLTRDLMRIEYMEKILLTEMENDNKANDHYPKIVSLVKTTMSTFDVNQEQKLKDLLNEWVTNDGGCPVDVEQMSLLTLTGFEEGHWFKCIPNNHIYAVKDVSQRCPQCNLTRRKSTQVVSPVN